MTDRPAIVAGASSGIGREAAIALSKAGCSVVLAARRKASLEEVARACPGETRVECGDVTSSVDVARMIAAASGLSSRGLPIVVYAAGLASFGPTDEVSEQSIRDQIEVNLTSAILFAKASLPWLLSAGGGDVALVGSIASTQPFPSAAGYVASKFGLLGFCRSLREEYRARGIRVSAILPGSTDTPLWDAQGQTPEWRDMLGARAVAEAICGAVLAPRDRSFDEILIMPPKGIL